MWDFLYLLFAGTCIFTKYNSEKVFRDNYESISHDRSQWNKEMIEKLSPPQEEYQDIINRIEFKPGVAMEEVSDALIQVFGQDYKTVFSEKYFTSSYKETIYDYHHRTKFWLRQLILAKHGYIDPKYASFGYKYTNSSLRDTNIKMCQQIENYLHLSGHNDMYLYAYDNEYDFRLFWLPEWYPSRASRKIHMQYKRLW